MIRIPPVANEFFDSFHPDSMTVEAAVTLDIDRSHVPVTSAHNKVGRLEIRNLWYDRFSAGKLGGIYERIMDKWIRLMALNTLSSSRG